MEDTNYTKKIYFLFLGAFVVLLGFLFKTLSSVFLPVIASVLASCVFAPIVQRIHYKTKIPWVVVSVAITLFVVVVFLGISSLLITGLTSIAAEYPKYETKFISIYKIIADNFQLEFDEGKSLFGNFWQYLKFREYVQSLAVSISSGVVESGKNFFIVIILLLFILIEYRLTNKKILHAFAGKSQGKILRLSKRIINEVVHYVSIKFFISLLTGFGVFLITVSFGMGFPIVWAFIAFTMNFIPTFGSIFSCGITTLFAIVEFYPNYQKTVIVLILLILINFAFGNIIEPRVQGKNLGLSPFVIIVSLILWGYIWGATGMIIAVPMTVIIKIICENISYLHVYAIMLGNDPRETKKNFPENK